MPLEERYRHWQQGHDEELVDAAEAPERHAVNHATRGDDGAASVLFYGAEGRPFAQYTCATRTEAHRMAWQYVAGGTRHDVQTQCEGATTHYFHMHGEREAEVRLLGTSGSRQEDAPDAP